MQNAFEYVWVCMWMRMNTNANTNALSTLRRVAVISALRVATNKNRLKNRMTANAGAETLNNNNHVYIFAVHPQPPPAVGPPAVTPLPYTHSTVYSLASDRFMWPDNFKLQRGAINLSYKRHQLPFYYLSPLLHSPSPCLSLSFPLYLSLHHLYFPSNSWFLHAQQLQRWLSLFVYLPVWLSHCLSLSLFPPLSLFPLCVPLSSITKIKIARQTRFAILLPKVTHTQNKKN